MTFDKELASQITKRVDEFIDKNHADEDMTDVRSFLHHVVGRRAEAGSPVTDLSDARLDILLDTERKRRQAVRKAAQQLRSEQATTDPMYSGMAIGLMLAAEPNAHLRGLISGLANLKDEEVEGTASAITDAQENDGGKEE
jgi:hypothetical protein